MNYFNRGLNERLKTVVKSTVLKNKTFFLLNFLIHYFMLKRRSKINDKKTLKNN